MKKRRPRKKKPRGAGTRDASSQGQVGSARVEVKPAVAVKPDAHQLDDVPLEIVRHLLGSLEPPPGSTIHCDEEQRRLQAIASAVRILAAQHGLNASAEMRYAPELPATDRAAEIREVANPQMRDGADTVKIRRRAIQVTKADGSIVRLVETEFEQRGLLKHSVGALAELASAPFHVAAGLTIKVGRWLKVKAAGEGEGERK